MALDTDCNVAWSTVLDGATTVEPGPGRRGAAQGRPTWSRGPGPRHTPAACGCSQGPPAARLARPDGQGTGHRLGHHRRPHRPRLPGPARARPPRGSTSSTARATRLVAVLNGPSTKIVLGFQNSPLVTDDPNGTVGITLAGYGGPGGGTGYVEHYEIPGSNGALAVSGGLVARVPPRPPAHRRRRHRRPGAPGRARCPRPPWAATTWWPPTGGSSPSAARRSAGRPGGQR